jgi:dTDP-glucose 4,6-dehydratase
MKILVTGGLGFIGSNFILQILDKLPEHNIINLDAEIHGSNLQSLSTIEKYDNYQYVKGNITDSTIVNKFVQECDVVINFAAESHVDRSISNAKPFIDSNIVGTFTILESIRKFEKKLLHISTDEVFGSLDIGSANEISRLNPSSPYASSKASAELLVNSYFITYGCNVLISRCTNNFGPRQFPEKLIPKTIIRASMDKKIPIYGNGKNIRDWIFVEDHCNALIKILKEGEIGESYNISTSNEIDNITIVEKILSYMGKSKELIQFVEDRPGHDFRYSLDSSKLRSIDWIEKTSFEEGIMKTVDWYLTNKEWWSNLDPRILADTPWK